MPIINLKMPEKLREITVKVVRAPYDVGEEIYCDIRIFGDVQKNMFRMKISKTLWHSLYKCLVERFELGGDAEEEIDENLECITGKIMTIYAKPDINRAYVTKDGGVDSPKIFDVYLREDLEELEKIGGDLYNQTVNKENRKASECIKVNMIQTYDEEIKKLEREIKKEKREEIAKQDEQKSLGWR